ncbi:hypothetical protein GGR50DRAFT_478286 [Xylaria sp. CBS 124048]|nr:hypothetical protein GGR50DRAFT_478286 [Xylaria sp. CBS 124048]
MDLIGPGVRSKIWEILFDDHKRNLKKNEVVLVYLSEENEHGDQDVEFSKQNLLPVTLSICHESREYTLGKSPKPLLSSGTVDMNKDILYFPSTIARNIALHQTECLAHISGMKSVAIDLEALCESEQRRQILAVIFGRLRKIETIIIAVPPRHPSDMACHNKPLVTQPMQANTVLDDGKKFRNWSELALEIQQICQSVEFWTKCNSQYAMHQILPVKIGQLLIPKVRLMRIARDCGHETSLCMTTQIGQVVPEARKDDLEKLEDPCQSMVFPPDDKNNEFSLKHLLE